MKQNIYFIATLAICFSVLLVESYNPSEAGVMPTAQELLVADPQRNITCLGAHSDIGWNLEMNLHTAQTRYDGRSMQKLCAHPVYGGMDDSLNFGGYCHQGDVFFATYGLSSQGGPYSREGPSPSGDSNWGAIRSYLECRNRCFCNFGLDPPNVQPRQVASTRNTREEDNAIAFAMDRRDPAQGRSVNMVTRVYSINHSNSAAPDWSTRPFEDVAILAGNMIRCYGFLPAFELPDGFDQHAFENNQKLCATQLAGGDPAANAGAYCHRSATSSISERVISFADDQTPRIGWTWDGGAGASFLLTAALRFHCWKNCLCARQATKPNFVDPSVGMWQYLVSKFPETFVGPKNSHVPLGSSTDSQGKTRTTSLGSNSPPAQCAADPGKPGVCSLPWPVEVLGPVPRRFVELGAPLPPATAVWDQARECGNECAGPKDCGGDCLCRLPTPKEANIIGLDPVAPSRSFCLKIDSIFG